MKREFNAKVVGHDVFVPDPKGIPLREEILVKLVVSSLKPAMGKPRKAVLPIERADLEEWPIGRSLRVTITDNQQHLEFPKRTKPENGQGEMGIVPGKGKKHGEERGPEVTH
jgi:hypothetical protein